MKNVFFIVLILLCAGLSQVQYGAEFTVSTTQDMVPGSLRAAIDLASSNNEDNIINLPAGVYILTGKPGEDANKGGDLDIDVDFELTIRGESENTTFIDGDSVDRVIHIIGGRVTIENITVRNGRGYTSQYSDLEPRHGGGIYNAAILTLRNCTISGNTTRSGQQNSAYTYVSGKGGGIHNAEGGNLTILNCLISENATGNGSNSWSAGRSGAGGGISNSGTLTVKNSVIKDCRSGNAGSGLYPASAGGGGGLVNGTYGVSVLTDCEISGNTTGNGGGAGKGAGSAGEGGGVLNYGHITMNRCAIVGNRTGNGADGGDEFSGPGIGGHGGGIYNRGANMSVLSNCTISGNITGGGGDSGFLYDGGQGGSGGGIWNGGNLEVTSCTIANNQIGPKGSFSGTNPEISSGGGSGGGIFNSKYYVGIITITNTIVAGNSVTEDGEGPDLSGDFTSGGYNLVQGTGGWFVAGDFTGNILGADPLLAPLTLNGGSLPVHELKTGSPAIDKGTAAGLTLDQLGNVRPVDIAGITNAHDGSDIGAFERPSPYAVSGRVTYNSKGLAGVTLTFSNNGGTVSTDSDGYYAHPVTAGWAGTVTPSKEHYSFSPAERAYSAILQEKTDQDYTASGNGLSVRFTNVFDGDTTAGTLTVKAEVTNHALAASARSYNRVEFYVDGNLMATDDSEPYRFDWVTGESGDGLHTLTAKAYNNAGQMAEHSVTVTVASENVIGLSRKQLNLSHYYNSSTQFPQELVITNTGLGTMRWSLTSDVEWLSMSPDNGVNSGKVSVSARPPQTMGVGTYTGTITVDAEGALNTPQEVSVTLAIYQHSATNPPFGSLDTPLEGAAVYGSVPVTGWVLDDLGVYIVNIYRDPAPGEGTDPVFIGNATRVEGARPDIMTAYPGYPDNSKAGWGYMLLTHFLPNKGNGQYTLYAKARDLEGNWTTLGKTRITCDNENAVEPFGAVDTPDQGATVTSLEYTNFGWALTPQPNTIPLDGSTIKVWVDGLPIGSPVYNRYREDIAEKFPGYNNTDGAVGYFKLNLKPYKDGVHTIAWSVRDDAGNVEGIGSRYFTVMARMGDSTSTSASTTTSGPPVWAEELAAMPETEIDGVQWQSGFRACHDFEGIEGITGVAEKMSWKKAFSTIVMRQCEPLKIRFGEDFKGVDGGLMVGSRVMGLPPGSTLREDENAFYWLPGPASYGEHRLVFVGKSSSGNRVKKIVYVVIK